MGEILMRDTIVRGLKPFVRPGEVYELRILDCVDNPQYRPFTMSGYFEADRLEELAAAALDWTQRAVGCYVTMNPVKPDLLARAANRVIRAGRGASTSGADILARRRLTIDFDPERMAGVSATAEELDLAFELARIVECDLAAAGWPEPLLAGSGNGAHLNYGINLPAEDEGLVERFLAALSTKHSTPAVKIDTALFDAPRIIKLYGTWSRKGDSIPDRPHRLSAVISAPESLEIVSKERLQAFVRENPVAEPEAKQPKGKPAKAKADPKSSPKAKVAKPEGVISPGDDFNARGDLVALMGTHGWSVDQELPDGEIRLTRPGKGGGTSATIGHNKGLHVFTGDCAALPFQAGENYSPFECFALLEHGGDRQAAAKALVRLGYGTCRDGAGEIRQNPPPAKSKTDRPSHAEILLGLASAAKLSHAPDGRSFARVPVDEHTEAHAILSSGFRSWLRHQFYRAEGGPPSAEALQGALATLEAIATFDGPEEPYYVRVAPSPDGGVYIDLGDAAWSAIKVTPDGWGIVADPPVAFLRSKGTRPLPAPERGGTMDDLKKFLRVDRGQWLLLIAWITASLRPTGPYPLLMLGGEQGAAKSTTAKTLRKVVDPHAMMLRSEPKELRDLMIGACGGWIYAIDNISHLPDWMSDGLCRLVTGGGFATRTLYENGEETFFDAIRPSLIAAIDDVVHRGDLADRRVIVTLEPIPESERKTEEAFWAAFDEAAPKIMGAVLDALSSGLKTLPTVTLDRLPRMADFARWGEAVCRGIGAHPGEFLAAYTVNREQASEAILDGSALAHNLREWMKGRTGEWKGTARNLLTALDARAGEKVVEAKGWPKSPRSLSGILRRLAPELRKVGVDIQFSKEGHDKTRTITISEVSPQEKGDLASAPSAPSAGESKPLNGNGLCHVGHADGMRTQTESPSAPNGFASAAPGLRPHTVRTTVRTEPQENRGKNGIADAKDGADAKSRKLSGREVFEL